MIQSRRNVSSEGLIIAGLLFMNAIILNAAVTESKEYYKALFASLPLLVIMILACIVK